MLEPAAANPSTVKWGPWQNLPCPDDPTSIAAIFAVEELTGRAYNVNSLTFRSFEVFSIVAVIYVVLTIACSLALALLSGWAVMSQRVRDGMTTALGSFTNLSDICSFVVSPSRRRWYFHHEYTSQFAASGSETAGEVWRRTQTPL